jgi:hypothetical protein
MKLATFLGSPDLTALIESTVLDVNVLVAEVYAFANLHVTRLLQEGRVPDDVGPGFYHRCMSAVSICKVQESSLDEDMLRSIEQFDSLRQQGKVRRIVRKVRTVRSKLKGKRRVRTLKDRRDRMDRRQGKVDATLLGDIRSELCIGMAAMASNHLWMNLHGRIKKYLAWSRPDIGKAMRTVIADCVALHPKVALANVKRLSLRTGKGKEVSANKQLAVTAATAVIQEMRALCPLSGVGAASKAHLLLPLYWKIMRETETAFELLRAHRLEPCIARRLAKTRFAMLPYKHGFTVSSIPICSRAFVGLLRRLRRPDGSPVEALTCNNLKPEEHNRLWRKYGNVNMVETRSRRFGGRISTDGVAVTVHMSTTQALVLPSGEEEFDPSMIPETKLTIEYAGVDPGLTDVVTVVHKSTGKASSFSSSRYYEEAKVKLSNRRTARWNKETADSVARIVHGENKATVAGLSSHLKSYLSEHRGLIEHRAERGYRNMRFMRYIHKQKVVSVICNMIAPKDRFTVVGFGDWKGIGDCPIKRRFSGPIQDIKRELKRRSMFNDARVLFRSVWEYRTSVTCHATWRRLSNMKAVSVAYDRKQGRMVEQPCQKVHKVLHCTNSKCAFGRQGATWNRDVNASRNILMLLMLAVRGFERPSEFKPSQLEGRRGKKSKKGLGASPDLCGTLSPSSQEVGNITPAIMEMESVP